MAHDALERAWQSGRPAIGGWVSLPSTRIVEIFAGSGAYDFILIDCQHSLIDESVAGTLLANLHHYGAAGVVRVGINSPERIGRVLDAGADAVIVPMVNTEEEAIAAARACRYAPNGVRSFGPIRRDLGLDPVALEARTSCFVMIETSQAVDNVRAICEVPGVDGVFVGPGDLAISLGLYRPGEFLPPTMRDVLAHIQVECDAAGKIAGVAAGAGQNVKQLAADGFRFMSLAPDASLLMNGARADVQLAAGDSVTSNGRTAASPYGS